MPTLLSSVIRSMGCFLDYTCIIAQVEVNVEIYFQESLCVGDIDGVTVSAASLAVLRTLTLVASQPPMAKH